MLFKIFSFFVFLYLTTFLFSSSSLKLRIYSILTVSTMVLYIALGKWFWLFLAISVTAYFANWLILNIKLTRFYFILILLLVCIFPNFIFAHNIFANFRPVELSEKNFINTLCSLGFSIYLLRIAAYLIKSRRDKCASTESFLKFLAAAFYFPQVLSGSAIDINFSIDNFSNHCKYDSRLATEGVLLILFGLLKKVLISQRIYYIMFDMLNCKGSLSISLILSLLLPIFIFIEYSVFADIFLGISKIYNISIGLNFEYPFKYSNFSRMICAHSCSIATWFSQYVNTSLLKLAQTDFDRFFWSVLQIFLVSIWFGLYSKVIFILAVCLVCVLLEKLINSNGEKTIFSWVNAYVGLLFLAYIILCPNLSSIISIIKNVFYGASNFQFRDISELRIDTKLAFLLAIFFVFAENFRNKIKLELRKRSVFTSWLTAGAMLIVFFLFYPADLKLFLFFEM